MVKHLTIQFLVLERNDLLSKLLLPVFLILGLVNKLLQLLLKLHLFYPSMLLYTVQLSL